MERKRLIIGMSGASGAPLALTCLRELQRHREFETHLIISNGARLTIEQETQLPFAEFTHLADFYHEIQSVGDGPASGTFSACGMLIVPCSMKTAAGIRSGFSDNLLLRAADVTVKEKRTLVLAVRESPLSPIHLSNLLELSRLQNVWIIPPMLTYYNQASSIEEMTRQAAGKLLSRFGIQLEGYQEWNGIK